jgi:hypothetical protein
MDWVDLAQDRDRWRALVTAKSNQNLKRLFFKMHFKFILQFTSKPSGWHLPFCLSDKILCASLESSKTIFYSYHYVTSFQEINMGFYKVV